MAKKMSVQIVWAEDPAKVKLGRGKNATNVQNYFVSELAAFVRSFKGANCKISIGKKA